MVKKLWIVSLILVLALPFLTGCGQTKPTTLEGVWRVTEFSMNQSGKKMSLDYPITEDGVETQPYFQLEKGEAKVFIRGTKEGVARVFELAEAGYSLEGNKMTITYSGEDLEFGTEEFEATHSISGNTILITSSATVPMGEEMVEVQLSLKAVKTSASAVTGAEPLPDYDPFNPPDPPDGVWRLEYISFWKGDYDEYLEEEFYPISEDGIFNDFYIQLNEGTVTIYNEQIKEDTSTMYIISSTEYSIEGNKIIISEPDSLGGYLGEKSSYDRYYSEDEDVTYISIKRTYIDLIDEEETEITVEIQACLVPDSVVQGAIPMP